MIATVTDIGALVQGAAEEFSSLPANYQDAACMEINALQELYFMRFTTVREQISLPVTNNGKMNLSTAQSLFGRPLHAEWILSVFADDVLLPLLPYEEFLKTERFCCALSNETLYFRCPSSTQYIKPVFRFVPPAVVCSNGTFTGSIYIPDRHLPMLTCKLRQTMCALAGEYDAADYYARTFNAYAAQAAQENGNDAATSKTL